MYKMTDKLICKLFSRCRSKYFYSCRGLVKYFFKSIQNEFVVIDQKNFGVAMQV